MYGKPTSIEYTIEVVDIPIYKREIRDYKSTLKINLRLNYQKPPIPKGGKIFFSIPLSALKPHGISICTIKRLIDSVSSSQCSNNDIIYYFNNDQLIITINCSSIMSGLPITLDISYKILVNMPTYILPTTYNKKIFYLIDIIKNKLKSPFSKSFDIPIYDEIENECIAYNIILPAGWKVEYGRYYKQYHKPNPNELIKMICIEKKIYTVRRYKVNRFKLKRRTCLEHVVLFVEPEDLYYEDKFGNTPFYHNWEFNQNNRSVWNLIIYKKQLQHRIQKIYNQKNIRGFKEVSFGFIMSAGSKNKIIVSLSKILVCVSILFIIICVLSLIRSIMNGMVQNIDYINYIFADIGLLTVIVAYFFSFSAQKNNGILLCIPSDKVQKRIRASVTIVILCAIILLILALLNIIYCNEIPDDNVLKILIMIINKT